MKCLECGRILENLESMLDKDFHKVFGCPVCNTVYQQNADPTTGSSGRISQMPMTFQDYSSNLRIIKSSFPELHKMHRQ